MITKKQFNVTNCFNCGETFSFEDEDVEYLGHNLFGFICPTCGHEIITKVKKCIEFPDEFYSFKDGISVSNEKIAEEAEGIKNFLLENKDETFAFWATGNTIVIGYKLSDGNISIIVSKDYYEAFIVAKENK